MFNLEKSIADWRQQMLAAGLNTPVPLEELEMHLREEIEQLVRAGRTEPEAFESAVQRMGHAPVVHGEFKKISTADGKFEWLLMEIFFAIMGSVFPLWFCAKLLNFKTVSKVDFPHEQQVSGLVAMGLYAGFIWAGRLGYKMLPVLPRKRQRSVLHRLLQQRWLVCGGLSFHVIASCATILHQPVYGRFSMGLYHARERHDWAALGNRSRGPQANASGACFITKAMFHLEEQIAAWRQSRCPPPLHQNARHVRRVRKPFAGRLRRTGTPGPFWKPQRSQPSFHKWARPKY